MVLCSDVYSYSGRLRLDYVMPLQAAACLLSSSDCNSRLYLDFVWPDCNGREREGSCTGRLPALINGVGRYLLCNPDCIDLFHRMLLPALFCDMCLLLWHIATANWQEDVRLLLLLQSELPAVVRWAAHPSVLRPEHYNYGGYLFTHSMDNVTAEMFLTAEKTILMKVCSVMSTVQMVQFPTWCLQAERL